MENSILNLKSITALCILTASSVAQAGTAGMTGQWDFDGYMRSYDETGTATGEVGVVGAFDFDADTVYLESDMQFFGMTWFSDGDLTDQGNGTYLSDHTASWGVSTFGWDILWEITQTGNTATVVTLDADSDGIPGTMITDGTFVNLSFEVNGTLTAVPLPASAWLFATGVVGLAGAARRKSRRGH